MSFLLIFLTTSIAAWMLLVILIPISAHIGLVDKPCARKQHNGEIPLIGGFAIATSLLSVCQQQTTQLKK